MNLLGFCGAAGAGKDAAAAALCAHGWARVSLVDPLKEACALWFGWSREQLWGPSELRNQPDPAWDGLTPRRALQLLGTEGVRALHPDVWARLALRRAAERLAPDPTDWTRAPGCAGVVVPDVRFANEAEAIRAAGGRVVRVVRPGLEAGEAWRAHASEAQDFEADWHLVNDGSLEELQAAAAALPERNWKCKP